MCVPILVKINWEMPVKNPRSPPQNLVFCHFNITPRWFPAHHRDRLVGYLVCLFHLTLLFEQKKENFWYKCTQYRLSIFLRQRWFQCSHWCKSFVFRNSMSLWFHSMYSDQTRQFLKNRPKCEIAYFYFWKIDIFRCDIFPLLNKFLNVSL